MYSGYSKKRLIDLTPPPEDRVETLLEEMVEILGDIFVTLGMKK